MTRQTNPTVADYLAWARSQNCDVQLSRSEDGAGYCYQIARITTPRKCSAIEIFRELSDELMSTTVARLDRRLGLKSYMFV